jgi:hypothetical protein
MCWYTSWCICSSHRTTNAFMRSSGSFGPAGNQTANSSGVAWGWHIEIPTGSHSAHSGRRVTQKNVLSPRLRGSVPPRDTPTHPNVIACQPRRFHATVARNRHGMTLGWGLIACQPRRFHATVALATGME